MLWVRPVQMRCVAARAVHWLPTLRASVRDWRSFLGDLCNKFDHKPKEGELVVLILRSDSVAKPFERAAQARIDVRSLKQCDRLKQVRFDCGKWWFVGRRRVVVQSITHAMLSRTRFPVKNLLRLSKPCPKVRRIRKIVQKFLRIHFGDRVCF